MVAAHSFPFLTVKQQKPDKLSERESGHNCIRNWKAHARLIIKLLDVGVVRSAPWPSLDPAPPLEGTIIHV